MATSPHDYAVKVSVRNGRILRMMQAKGIANQMELARRAGVGVQSVNRVICLRDKPICRSGAWREVVERIAGVLGCDPEDMFSDAQRDMALETNSHELFMDEGAVASLASHDPEQVSWAKIEVERLLTAVTSPRGRAIVMARAEGARLDELAEEYGVCRERIRQFEAKALRQMRARAIKHGKGAY